MTCLQIHEDEKGDGDVLVFLPGQEDIEALSQLLRENLATLRAEKSRYVRNRETANCCVAMLLRMKMPPSCVQGVRNVARAEISRQHEMLQRLRRVVELEIRG